MVESPPPRLTVQAQLQSRRPAQQCLLGLIYFLTQKPGDFLSRVLSSFEALGSVAPWGLHLRLAAGPGWPPHPGHPTPARGLTPVSARPPFPLLAKVQLFALSDKGFYFLRLNIECFH